MSIVITHQNAKSARDAVGLSQALAAREAGITRAMLSQFENGHIIISDDDRTKLQDLYAAEGYDWAQHDIEEPSSEEATPQFVDGFLLPASISPEDVEEDLAELHDLDSQLTELLAAKAPAGFFGGTDEQGTRESICEAALLGLRCYSIVREIQGYPPLCEFSSVDELNLRGQARPLSGYLLQTAEEAK